MLSRRAIICAVPPLLLPKLGAARLRGRSAGGGNAALSPDGSQINTRDSIGGSLNTAYGVLSFGPGFLRGTSAGPPPTGSPFGPFCYVKLNGQVINSIGDAPNTGPAGAQQILLDYGGNVFFLTAQNDRWWQQFVDHFPLFVGSPVIDPPSVFPDPLPANYSPPYASSPDGSVLTGTPGTLTTADGIWSNGAGGSSYHPTLNGIYYLPSDPGGTQAFNSLQVGAAGQMFGKLTADNNWYLFLAGSRYLIGPSVPSGPIPTSVTLTVNPALVTGPPPLPVLIAGSTTPVTIASIAVTTSNGSAFAGALSLSVSPPVSWMVLVGSELKTNTNAVGPGGGALYFATVSAAQNGVNINPGASRIAVLVP